MALMHAPEIETQEPEFDPIDELLALREELDFGKCRAEILGGRLIVSPLPVLWHELACIWLYEAFRDACGQNGWLASRASEVELPATRDRIQPDLTILNEAGKLPLLEHVMPLSQVLLVAEVISPSGVREDREVKPRSCAAAAIPFYLLVDRFTPKVTVRLHAGPDKEGYLETHSVPVGGLLKLPEPFGLTLDTGTLPLPK